jgi:hypothetical protein
MKPPLRQPAHDSFLAGLDDDDSAAALLFVECCRQSPALRRWLWRDFARHANVRSSLAKRLRDGVVPPTNGAHSLAELTGEGHAWREEQRRLKAELPRLARPYGGLTWAEMEKLVRRYQAGTLDLGTFLLAHEWRGTGGPGKASPALLRSAGAFLDAVVHGGERRVLTHFTKALKLLDHSDSSARRGAALGYQERWKLHALFFMLRHPRPSYRTRELRAHLALRGLKISTKDIRRFCTRHDIRRDMRAGRPTKTTES